MLCVVFHSFRLFWWSYLKVYNVNVIFGNFCDFGACTSSAPAFAGKRHAECL